jgi:hypothetical protein
MPMENAPDPFRESRVQDGVLACPFQGETVPMILRHGDVRRAAKDWKTFSSDAPFRVPIPSEEAVRTMRQLPVETDPPAHWRLSVSLPCPSSPGPWPTCSTCPRRRR